MSLANADPTSTEFPHCARTCHPGLSPGPVTRACHPGLSPEPVTRACHPGLSPGPVTRACHPGLSPEPVTRACHSSLRLPGLIWDCMGLYGSQWASVGFCGRRRVDERRGWMVVAAEGSGKTPLRRARHWQDGAGRLFVKRHWLGRLGQSRTTAPNGWLISCRRRPMRGPRAPPAPTGGPARCEREGRNGRLVSAHDAPPARYRGRAPPFVGFARSEDACTGRLSPDGARGSRYRHRKCEPCTRWRYRHRLPRVQGYPPPRASAPRSRTEPHGTRWNEPTLLRFWSGVGTSGFPCPPRWPM
jgi:hypothetical protein